MLIHEGKYEQHELCKSQKFHGGKIHNNHPKDQLDILMYSDNNEQIHGRKHFNQHETIGIDKLPKLHLKTYENSYKQSPIFSIIELKKIQNRAILKDEQIILPISKNNKQIGKSKLKAMMKGNKKYGIYRNFYKSQIKSTGNYIHKYQ